MKGGAERALLELVDALKKFDVEPYIVLPGQGPLIDELKQRGVAYCILPYRWWMGKNSSIWKRMRRVVLNLAMAILLAVKIKRWKCDIVYTNTITVCVGALAARLLGLPHVWHIHEFGYEDHGLVFDLGSKLSLWLMKHLSTICIANSHAVAQKYQRYIEPSKVKVIYYSVSVPQNISDEKACVIPNSGIRCVIVGTLQEGKRQEDAIRAISELVHRRINVELFIIGDGDPKYRNYLHELVSENKLDENVRFLGYVENPFPFMKSADVVLMCSRNEAFGRVTVEAMKLGKPVVGARSGGTVELIKNGVNGLLYTPGDYKELAEKIIYLYEHPEIAKQMGENGKKWAEQQFTEERYGNEVFALLKQLVSLK